MHAFPATSMTDDERQNLAAGWIETGVLDLRRALAALEGRAAGPAVHNLILSAEAAAEVIRKDKAQVATVKD